MYMYNKITLFLLTNHQGLTYCARECGLYFPSNIVKTNNSKWDCSLRSPHFHSSQDIIEQITSHALEDFIYLMWVRQLHSENAT